METQPQEDRLKFTKREYSSSGVGRSSDALELGAGFIHGFVVNIFYRKMLSKSVVVHC